MNMLQIITFLCSLSMIWFQTKAQNVSYNNQCEIISSELTPCDSLRKSMNFDWKNASISQIKFYLLKLKYLYPRLVNQECVWDDTKMIDRYIISDENVVEIEKHYLHGPLILYFKNGRVISEKEFHDLLEQSYYQH